MIGIQRILVTVLLIFFPIVGSALAADVAKIGVVDIQRVLENSSAGKAAQAQIKERFGKLEDDLKKHGAEIEELRKQLEREAMVMSQDKREDKERQYRIKVGDLQSLEKRYRAEVKELQQKLLGRINNDVVKLIDQIGKEEGFLLIVRSEAALYNPTSIDITDRLIQQYNVKYASGDAEAAKKD
jgi:outer membrane protein